jgi:hypothetical protein
MSIKEILDTALISGIVLFIPRVSLQLHSLHTGVVLECEKSTVRTDNMTRSGIKTGLVYLT